MHVRLISSTVCKKCSIFIFCFHIFVTFIYTQMAFFKSKSCIKTATIYKYYFVFFINHVKREELDLQNEMIQQKVIWIFWKKSRQKKKLLPFHAPIISISSNVFDKKIVFGNVASPKKLLILAIEASYTIIHFHCIFPPFFANCVWDPCNQTGFFVFLQDMWTFKCTCVILQSFCPKNDFLCEMKLKCCSILNFQTSGFTSKNLCINRMESKVHGVQLNSNQFLWFNFLINY